MPTPELAGEVSLWGMFWQAHLVVKIVMIGLLLASVWSWACCTSVFTTWLFSWVNAAVPASGTACP